MSNPECTDVLQVIAKALIKDDPIYFGDFPYPFVLAWIDDRRPDGTVACAYCDLPLGQTPLEYVTGWRMQKAIQLLERRDKKLREVARLVGYESDASFSKAFKRVVRANPGEYLRRGLKDPKSTEAGHDQSQ